MKAQLPELSIITCMVALLPLLFPQAVHLWERPHFQFFPIAWLACAGLVYYRAQLQPAVGLWRTRLGAGTWGLGVLVGIGAAVFFSPWLAQAAAILCVTGWGSLRLGGLSIFRWLGWTLLLWITLPLPGQLDADVVGGLQRLSAESAGNLLDLLGIAHLRQGTLIEIRAGKLFVDEACSGIDSLYSLAAIALLMMLWQERPLVIGLLTFVTVPVWAWLGNVIRLTLIVVLLDRMQIDLSQGWSHTILGLFTFGMSSLFLLATLHGFAKLFQRFSMSALPRERTWHLRYNALVCFPGKPPVVADETDQYFDTSRTPQTAGPKLVPKEAIAVGTFSRPIVITLGVICLAILALNVRNVSRDWMDGRSNRLPHYELNQVSNAFAETGFPDRLGSAMRVQFNSEHRTPDSFLGEYSRSWIYRDAICDFIMSIDFPFRGYHPLWVCYTNAGNTMLGRPEQVTLPSSNSADAERHAMRAKFRDDLGNESYLWFVLLQHDGQLVPIQTYEQDGGDNLLIERLKNVLAQTVQRDPVTYQFQLYVPSSRQLNEQELADYLAFFDSALPMAREQIRKLPQ